jgi:hypothetical protein
MLLEFEAADPGLESSELLGFAEGMGDNLAELTAASGEQGCPKAVAVLASAEAVRPAAALARGWLDGYAGRHVRLLDRFDGQPPSTR